MEHRIYMWTMPEVLPLSQERGGGKSPTFPLFTPPTGMALEEKMDGCISGYV